MRIRHRSSGPKVLTRSSPALRASPSEHSTCRTRHLLREPRGQDTRSRWRIRRAPHRLFGMKRLAWSLVVVAGAWCPGHAFVAAQSGVQNRQAPGTSIGTISTQGNLIVFTLNEDALGRTNLFDLTKQTLRFKPDHGGYRVEHPAFAWDADFGAEAAPRTPVSLKKVSV